MLLFSFLLVMASCVKDETEVAGTIYGKVTDSVTGEVLSGVTMTLTPSGKSVTTGSNGIYEFVDMQQGQYQLQGQKDGYKSNTKSVSVVAGEAANGDLLLEQDSKFSLSAPSLNFGTDNTSLSFDVQNIGSVRLNWNVASPNADWLSVSPASGTLEAGKSNAVVVSIDRSKVTSKIEATLVVSSDKESKTVKVSAEPVTLSNKIQLSTQLLDFGTGYSSLTFDIGNVGNAGVAAWTITGGDADWIKSITPMTGNVNMGSKASVKVEIDRSKITEAVSTNILVNSEGASTSVRILADKGTETPGGDGDKDVKIVSCDENLIFTLESCVYSSNTGLTKMTYKVKNVGSSAIKFSMYKSSDSCSIIDDAGNSYEVDAMQLGTMTASGYTTYTQNIPADNAIKGVITVKKLAADATKFSVMRMGCSVKGVIMVYTEFRNIPITRE